VRFRWPLEKPRVVRGPEAQLTPTLPEMAVFSLYRDHTFGGLAPRLGIPTGKEK